MIGGNPWLQQMPQFGGQGGASSPNTGGFTGYYPPGTPEGGETGMMGGKPLPSGPIFGGFQPQPNDLSKWMDPNNPDIIRNPWRNERLGTGFPMDPGPMVPIPGMIGAGAAQGGPMQRAHSVDPRFGGPWAMGGAGQGYAGQSAVTPMSLQALLGRMGSSYGRAGWF